MYLLYINVYLHIIYRHVFVESGNYKGKYRGLAEGFLLVNFKDNRANSMQ